ncbi:MAG: hypothetical protein ACK5IQ_06870 [Bacteroidales bacterium]
MQTANTYHIGGQLGEVFLGERNDTWNFAISERRAKFHLDYAECEQNHVNNTPYLFKGKVLNSKEFQYYMNAYNANVDYFNEKYGETNSHFQTDFFTGGSDE